MKPQPVVSVLETVLDPSGARIGSSSPPLPSPAWTYCARYQSIKGRYAGGTASGFGTSFHLCDRSDRGPRVGRAGGVLWRPRPASDIGRDWAAVGHTVLRGMGLGPAPGGSSPPPPPLPPAPRSPPPRSPPSQGVDAGGSRSRSRLRPPLAAPLPSITPGLCIHEGSSLKQNGDIRDSRRLSKT